MSIIYGGIDKVGQKLFVSSCRITTYSDEFIMIRGYYGDSINTMFSFFLISFSLTERKWDTQEFPVPLADLLDVSRTISIRINAEGYFLDPNDEILFLLRHHKPELVNSIEYDQPSVHC